MRPAEPTTVVDCSGVGPGGITRVLTEITRHWPSGRLRLVAVPSGWDPPAGSAADVDVVSRQAGDRARTVAAATNALRKVTARAKAGLVTVLSLSPSVAVVGSRLPVTTVVHDLAFRLWPHGLPTAVRQYRRASYGTAIKRSRRLLCVSARTRHDLLGLYGVPEHRTVVWHPGSDLHVAPGGPQAQVRAATAGRPYLVVAGHAAHKGVELAVEALPDIPGHVLAVLTSGQRIERFEAAVAASPAADRVLLLDQLSDDDYAATIAGAAAFLMPSHFEGYGLPAAEALRLGTPTVISPDPALHEATDGRAVRMTTWTASAVVRAVTEATGAPRPPVGATGRSWREATLHLADLLAADNGHDLQTPATRSITRQV
ncbi:glycosyltransferase involved in cell wall biosynthesis [Micromonospora jinlongensis]|uniref:Glycosyltransferase involved in cell wall biosynthesis n=1 Tax=Micromonospora jinlongensis TaxID=1287877 RepID=A0A7Z0BF97_9ACTN|nr:glycosyltransferase [Micromonospora jinlongensis]NYH45268.1 glycosyltransferase involved in cell wall biosynthesis [Micromonospora jinlongensis]